MKKTFRILFAVLFVFILAFSVAACTRIGENGETFTTQNGATLLKISISGYTTEFEKGTDFSTGNIAITATYSDDTTKTIVIADCTVDSADYNKDEVGQYTIKISYGETETTYTVSVVDNTVTYALTVVGGTGGGTYPAGTQVSVTATVPSGKRFVNWTVGGVEKSTNASYTFSLTADTTITANFIQQYTLTVVGGTGSGTYDEGAQVSVTATVPEGKRFVKWTVGGEEQSTNATYSFNLTADTTITANFIQQYTLTVVGGTGSGTYDEGEQVTATATVPEGKRFVKWTVGGVEKSTSATYSFNLTADTTITANFIQQYTLTVVGGTGSGTYDEGAQVSVTATVPEGKRFVKWTVGGVDISTSATYSFILTADTTVAANFEEVITQSLSFTLNSAGTEYSVAKGTISDSNIVIPATYNNKPVTAISNYAFYSCTELASVTLLDNMTSIGDFAFSYCIGLTSITIPDSVAIIGGYVFYGCAEDDMTIYCEVINQPSGWNDDWNTQSGATVIWGYTGE